MSPRAARCVAACALLSALSAGCAAPEREPEHRPAILDAPRATIAAASLETAPAAANATRPDARGPLDVAACIELAIANSRAVRIAERRILIAEDRLTEAWSYQLPRASLTSRYAWRNNEPGASFGGNSFVTGQRQAGGTDRVHR